MSEKIYVEGKKRLYGEVVVGGSKNSALACIAGACLATDGKQIILTNVPNISDIHVMSGIIRNLGKEVSYEDGTLRISGYFHNVKVSEELASKIRASMYFLGVLLACMGEVICGLPGGDNIGDRPIDIHLNGFKKLGAISIEEDNNVHLKLKNHMEGKQIYLKYPSVGATCNLMIAASRASGRTVIDNAAKEPEIVDLGTLLTKMGVRVIGAGTDRITVYGTDVIHGAIKHEVISDRIEAGVLAIATAMCGGKVLIKKSIPYHNYPLIAVLNEIGVEVDSFNDELLVKSNGIIEPFQVSMMPFPGVATDLQPAITAMSTVARGTSIIVDHVFENRFQYIYDLVKMGAVIEHNGNSIKVIGNKPLKGTSVIGSDIRAVSSLICAALVSDGITAIEGVYHLRRGYPNLENKLRDLGANIWIAEK